MASSIRTPMLRETETPGNQPNTFEMGQRVNRHFNISNKRIKVHCSN